MKYDSIGVFDSGVGGLTVLKELKELLPHENFIYVADTARLPYGTKSKEEIIKYTREIFQFFQEQKVKAVVVACNTSSASALNIVSKEFDFISIGVIEPGSCEAQKATQNKKIALMATDSTVNSGAYGRALKALDENIELKGVGCAYLVIAVEDGLGDNYIGKKIAREYLEQIEDFDYDTLILGCTHFPFAEDGIREYFSYLGKEINIINPAYATAAKLVESLKEKDLLNSEKNNSKIKYFATGDIKHFEEMTSKLLKEKYKSNKVKKLILGGK